MTRLLRIGTRGSDLARCQTGMVAEMLREHTGVDIETVVISTKGDRENSVPMTPETWSPGAFVSEIERALLDERIDAAVHSYKDMTTDDTAGLAVVATPERAAVHDVLIFASDELKEAAADGLGGTRDLSTMRIGTSSPRRAAQLRRSLGCQIEPIRGNVPTRLEYATSGRLDAVCLAAAGLERLGISPEHALALPLERFPTAPAQGALAVQSRVGTWAADLCAVLNHEATRLCAETERAFLRRLDAGCHTAVAATAVCDDQRSIRLHVQYLKDDGEVFDERFRGNDPAAIGGEASDRVLSWIGASCRSG